MRALAASAAIVSLAALAACARGPSAEPAGVAAVGATAAAWADGAEDGMGWFYLAEDGPRLAYGPPNSAAAVMMSCEGAGAVRMTSTGAARGPDTLTLSSGGASAALTAEVEADPVSGGWTTTTRTRADDPVMASFRRTGRLQAAGALDAGETERAAVEQFFAACD